MWKKQTSIEGVSARSVLELKALLYAGQQQQQRGQQGGAARRRHVTRGGRRAEEEGAGERNRGVEERERRDAAEAEAMTEEGRLRRSEAALADKAAAYDRLVHGEAADEGEERRGYGDDEDKGFLVDFTRKRYDEVVGSSRRDDDDDDDDDRGGRRRDDDDDEDYGRRRGRALEVAAPGPPPSIFAEPDMRAATESYREGRARSKPVVDVLEDFQHVSTGYMSTLREVIDESEDMRDLERRKRLEREERQRKRLAEIERKRAQATGAAAAPGGGGSGARYTPY
eukprot:m51a1_g10625 hypothetical protein (283) ;mRNA; f:18248-19571